MVRRLVLRKLRRLWRRDPRLQLEGFFWLGVARVASLTLPFRWTVKVLGFEQVDTTARSRPISDANSLTLARRISRALRRASVKTPWESNCLTMALAGAGMLRLRQVAATLVMGVIKDPTRSGGLAAHAWLSSGGIVLTGGAGHRKYNAVATFIYLASRQCTDIRPSL